MPKLQIISYDITKMSLVPIKLLKNVPVRNKLLKIKGETHELDKNDYIESRINVNRKAKNLLAIEDGSEIAKYYLHKKGLFEQIARDIKKEAKQKFGFLFRKTSTMEKRPIATKGRIGTDYILMEHSYEDGSGHYGMTRVNHDNKTAKIFDSMRNTESDFEEPLQAALGRGYKVTVGTIHGCFPRLRNASNTDLNPQPTGGFVSQSYNDFKRSNFAGGRGGIAKKYMQEAFVISQYDEMSQHHFCYMESLLAMMTSLGLVKPGPQDPRERLEYVKKFIWGIIHKYVPKVSRKTPQWQFFMKTFPYLLETTDSNGKRLPMKRGFIQVPPTRGTTKYRLKKMRLRSDIDPTWSLKKIVDWSRGTRKWIVPK